MKKLCFAFCGAFYEHKQALNCLQDLQAEYEILPAVSSCVLEKSKELLNGLECSTCKKVVCSMEQAEQIFKNFESDCLVVAPCTGNTLAKIANGISNETIPMLAKFHMRNNKPIIFAIATNDALGLNMFNLAKLINQKNVFFVPFKQDDPKNKPKSLKSDLSLLKQTIKDALCNVQTQPIIL